VIGVTVLDRPNWEETANPGDLDEVVLGSLEGDEALVAAAQADPSAFAELYNRYYPQIYRFAHRRTGDPSIAEDVAAETFLAAFKSLPRYEWRGIAFSAWLYRIAATVIAGQHRRNGGIAQVPLENTLYPLAEPISEEPGPDQRLEMLEEQRLERLRLQAALRKLTPDQRRALELRYSRPSLVPLAEVADRMGRSEGAVKLLLHRAIGALRRTMAAAPGFGPDALGMGGALA
jgi:RNA polymerase sigma-70 factor (ECF subfamily)